MVDEDDDDENASHFPSPQNLNKKPQILNY